MPKSKIRLNEKYKIACYKGDNLLNKRTEILGTCRRRNKYKLKNCDTKDRRHIKDTVTLT